MEIIFGNSNSILVHTLHRTPCSHALCSSPIQRTRNQINGFGVRFFDSLHPSAPSTLLTSLAHQSITRVCKLNGLFIATQGAAALSPRRAAPCCRGDHTAAHLAHCLARPVPRAPLSLLEETTPAPSRPQLACRGCDPVYPRVGGLLEQQEERNSSKPVNDK